MLGLLFLGLDLIFIVIQAALDPLSMRVCDESIFVDIKAFPPWGGRNSSQVMYSPFPIEIFIESHLDDAINEGREQMYGTVLMHPFVKSKCCRAIFTLDP